MPRWLEKIVSRKERDDQNSTAVVKQRTTDGYFNNFDHVQGATPPEVESPVARKKKTNTFTLSDFKINLGFN